MPSMPRVWPMMPPENREKAAQFVPNWNSMGMPVTTPTAKLIPKIRIQNRAASLYRASPVFSARAFSTTMMKARPMVSWGTR